MDRVPPHARLVVRRHLAHAPAAAFAWLTDFEERDVERAKGHVVAARRVVEREGERITLEGMLEIAGREIPGRAIVDLAPPGSWHAKLYDRKDRLVTFNDYRVEPDGQGGVLAHRRLSFRPAQVEASSPLSPRRKTRPATGARADVGWLPGSHGARARGSVSDGVKAPRSAPST